MKVLSEMKSVASTLQELTRFLTEERKNKDDAIQTILSTNHPMFRRIAELTKTPYRLFFVTWQEFGTWITARGWKAIDPDAWDEDSVAEWQHRRKRQYLKLTQKIFDDEGRLKPYDDSEWQDEWLQVESVHEPPDDEPLDDDDLPF